MRYVTRAYAAIGMLAVASLAVGCDEECGRLWACDIRDSACQQLVMREVACLRGGGETDLPRVTVVSESELLARYMTDSQAETPEEQMQRETDYKLWSRGLALFDLAPPNHDITTSLVERAARVAAVYFSETKEIYIVDRPDLLASTAAIEVFAHEIVHALQDAELDLSTYGKDVVTDRDSALALDAIVEGEAVHYQLLISLMLEEVPANEIDWQAFYSKWQSETLLEAEQDPAPYSSSGSRFPYAFGGALVSKLWLEHGRSGIDALFETPPRTTYEVMFGRPLADPTADRDALRARGLPILTDNFRPVGWTALGAWLTRMFAARMNVPTFDRLGPSQALAYDLFSVHHEPDSDALVAAWRVRTHAGFDVWLWPGVRFSQFSAWADADQREASLITGEPAAPENARTLSWQSPDAALVADERNATASTWPTRGLAHDGSIGCVVTRPSLKEHRHAPPSR